METDILIALAGAFAEDLAGAFTTGFTVRADEAWAEQAAERIAVASPRATELTAEERIFGRQRMSPDEAYALDHSKGLAGAEAVQHLAWPRAVARRLVADTAYLIEPLAAVLLEQTRVLSGQHATAIIAAHLKGTSHAHIA